MPPDASPQPPFPPSLAPCLSGVLAVSTGAILVRLVAALPGTGIVVNAVCPGGVATDMGGARGCPVAPGAVGVGWAATLRLPPFRPTTDLWSVG